VTAADRARAEAQRQGLPPTVTDPTTLARIAALLTATTAADRPADA
jgi:hypothetical protein